jgi:hypothetical protein
MQEQNTNVGLELLMNPRLKAAASDTLSILSASSSAEEDAVAASAATASAARHQHPHHTKIVLASSSSSDSDHLSQSGDEGAYGFRDDDGSNNVRTTYLTAIPSCSSCGCSPPCCCCSLPTACVFAPATACGGNGIRHVRHQQYHVLLPRRIRRHAPRTASDLAGRPPEPEA